MSTIMTNDRDLRQRLREIDSQLGDKREALSAVHRELDGVRRRYAQSEDPSVLAAGERLVNQRDALTDEIEAKQSEQVGAAARARRRHKRQPPATATDPAQATDPGWMAGSSSPRRSTRPTGCSKPRWVSTR